jgi:hypothetical protein
MSEAQAMEMGFEPFGKNGLKVGKKKKLNSSIVKAMKNL